MENDIDNVRKLLQEKTMIILFNERTKIYTEYQFTPNPVDTSLPEMREYN